MIKHTVLPVLLSTLWISFMEFTRNQLLFVSYWTDHYGGLGLTFPAEPLNGAVWGIWALLFSVFILILSRKFTFLETAFLAWLAGFVFMWLVIGNLGVLPNALLIYAVPLSMAEVAGAVWICRKLGAIASR